jgi:hypothetical protein
MGQTVQTLKEIEQMMEIQSHLLSSPNKKEALYNVQKHKYNARKGCFVAFFASDEMKREKFVVSWKFKDAEEIKDIFEDNKSQDVLLKRIAFSDPLFNFVLVTKVIGGPSYINSYYWNEFTPLKVPGVPSMVCSSHPVDP